MAVVKEFGLVKNATQSPHHISFSVRLYGYGGSVKYRVDNFTRTPAPDDKVSGIDNYIVVATERFIFWYEVVGISEDGTTILLSEL